MKEQVKAVIVPLLMLVLLGFFFAGCDLGDNGGGTHTLSGVVRDAASGAPADGITVSFGDSSATTGADGAYSLDLGAASGTVSGTWGLHGSGYSPVYAEGALVEADRDLSLTIYADPLDTSSYTTHQVDLTILDSGDTEIPDGSDVNVTVTNSTGGWSFFWHTYANPGTNNIDTTSFGSACLMAAMVDTGTEMFMAMKQAVDLSPATSTLTLKEGATTTVAVSGTAGNYGMLSLETPCGHQLEVWGDVLPDSPTDVEICNPFGYDGIWTQAQIDTTPPDSDIFYVSTSALGPIGSSVTLPAINTALAPSGGYPPGYSMSYAAGTLSWDEVAGADIYLIWIYEQAVWPDEPALLATVWISGTSVSLPSWIISEVSGKTADVILTAVGAIAMTNLAGLASTTAWPEEHQIAFVCSNGGTDPSEGYTQTISF